MLLSRAFLLACVFPAAVPADIFRIVDSDREAAQVRVDMIQQAKREILLSLHRASDDQLVLSYLSLLRDAARRGVKVRFLIDAMFNELSKPVQAHLLQEGVMIKEYHPFRLNRLRWMTRRFHDKVLLIDREQMLIGGRNLENPFFGVSKKSYVKRAYVDRDVYVKGEVVNLAYDYFIRLWNSNEVVDARLGLYNPKLAYRPCDDSMYETWHERCTERRMQAVRRITRAARLMDTRRAALAKGSLVHLNPSTDWSAGQRDIANIGFLHDPVGRKGIDPGTFEAFLEYADTAKTSIMIESPYLILSKNVRKVFARAIDRGVKIRVLTNSLASTQNFFAQGGYEGKKAKLVRMGLEIWEYKGPKMLHAKSVVIDDQVAIIGNFNIDPRSETLNTELAVVAHDAALAQELRQSMDTHLANAWLLGPDGKAIGESRRFPGVTAGRIIKLRFYQVLAALLRGHL